MKRTIAIVAILAAISLPVMAQEVVLTPTKLYDLIEELQKSTRAHHDYFSTVEVEQNKRIEALEKKVTHITRILKLKQEQASK